MFRILVVDDSPSVGHILREVAKDLRQPVELAFVADGEEALDFLHRRGAYAEARLPHLVLLDVNMPRLGGLATLSAIKADPELRIIPVIMFSTTTTPEDLRRSYQAHANGFVQKPADLRRSSEFIKAVEAFWMNFAQLANRDHGSPASRLKPDYPGPIPTPSPPPVGGGVSGPRIASGVGEDVGRDMQDAAARPVLEQSRRAGCEEHDRLLGRFGTAVQEILKLHEQQYRAIVAGEEETERFDLLIHMANEKKQAAKYDYLQHVAIHGCTNYNASEQA
jgi:two-component system, chemotaxis family, response regulator Rcp1